jgi:hypothetical protein
MNKIFTRVSHQKSLDRKDFVIQVTKGQLIKFIQFVSLLAIATLNILALKIASPFLKELFFSQVIIAFLFLSKRLNEKIKIKSKL